MDIVSSTNQVSLEELSRDTLKFLEEVIGTTSIINDLPKDVTLEEINSQLALTHGQSITIYLLKDDGEKCPIVVPQNKSTVLDLKKSIKKYFTLRLMREGIKKKISWRYHWKNNLLSFEGTKLTKDWILLENYGIKNKSTLTFVKRLRDKNKMKY